MNYYMKRTVTKEECSWLEENINLGIRVYPVEDTYHVCTKDGMLVSKNKSGKPFFEVPKDSVFQQYWVDFSTN